MRRFLFSSLFLACTLVHADCGDASFARPLEGMQKVPTCETNGKDCVSSAYAVHKFSEAIPDDPTVMTVTAQGSPWRIYGPGNRILRIDELAGILRDARSEGESKVVLMTSWSGVSPSPGVASLADQVSRALDGFPVEGQDGFLWISSKGETRTTHQAFTARDGNGSYGVAADGEVFVPLAAGWVAQVVDQAVGDVDPEYLVEAGVGWDAFMLCPSSALAMFERAGRSGSAVGSYNAAQMLLARGQAGDRDAAIRWLRQAAVAGDKPAAEQLASLAAEADAPAPKAN
ncbi:MAG TPA: hypothetical protein VFQ84_02605 [Arenimonas sp.]|uniref:hypothetical protein n=1 Tax=Arenimonas sp. TaxID=1872635 RepID=UPI002D7FB588|nr:hypothetical protein [Arenimonas sp.]HEU0152218.1 hypothetical protein [Arenimonas sp.]